MTIKCIGKGCPLADQCSNLFIKFDKEGVELPRPTWLFRSTYDAKRKECKNHNTSMENLTERRESFEVTDEQRN